MLSVPYEARIGRTSPVGSGSGVGSIVLGGTGQEDAANANALTHGPYSRAGGFCSVAIGSNCITNGSYSQAYGANATDNGVYGKWSWAGGQFNVQGDRQVGLQVLGAAAAANVAARLTADGNAASAVNTANLVINGSAAAFSRVTVVAFDNVNIKAAMWTVEGLLVRRGNTASATTIVGTPTITKVQADNSLSSATLVVTADTVNGGVNLTVTSPTAVRVVAEARTVEVN